MSSTTCHISMSLDGFVAGPNQTWTTRSEIGGTRLHEWAFETDSSRASKDVC